MRHRIGGHRPKPATHVGLLPHEVKWIRILTMARRYLTTEEAESAIKRGRRIECFVGAFGVHRAGLLWLSINAGPEDGELTVECYVSADRGGEDFVDVYEFGPLDEALEMDEPDQILRFYDFDSLWVSLAHQFPGSVARLVNEGVIQDVYLDFKRCA